VIGITTAIKSQSGGFEGIGFAIPGNHAKRIAAEIVRTRADWRPVFLGINFRPALDHELAQLPIEDGATALWVTGVVDDSPADNAGLKVNDVIIGYQGDPIRNMVEVINGIQYSKAGSTVELEILRAGQRQSVVATLRQRPQ
jgi:S1-C subfamily serine protease